MKLHLDSVLQAVPGAVAVALLLGLASEAGAQPRVAVADLTVHGKARCVTDDPPAIYVARRSNDQGLPTDDVTIVEGVLDTDTSFPAVRIALFADLSRVRPGLVRDVTKLFVQVAPDGSRYPLEHETPLDAGLTPFWIELKRPLRDHQVERLPMEIALRLRVYEGGPDGPELATSDDAAWRLVATAGESFGSAGGGTLIQLPGGEAAADDAQLAVLHGCDVMPHVGYSLTGIAIFGRGRTPTSRLKSVRVHRDTPDGPIVSEALGEVALPSIAIGRRVIDIPDVLVDDGEAAGRDFWVVVTFADGESDLVSHDMDDDVALPAIRKRLFFRRSAADPLEAAGGIAYGIDLLIDGRLQTAD